MTQARFIVLCMYCMSVYPGIMHENITVVDESVCKNDVDVHVYVFKKKAYSMIQFVYSSQSTGTLTIVVNN